MRSSQLIPKNRKEVPQDKSSPGTKLLVQAGFIFQVSRGIWAMTNIGLRVRRKVEEIIRKEMNKIGVELELPILQERKFWEETGRWKKYKDNNTALSTTGRTGSEYLLAPTAEEMITHFVRGNVSARDLPMTFWQMSPKFRDEMRARQGLVRGIEFLMKDAYSFGKTDEEMRTAYEQMGEVYSRIFTQLGFRFIRVEADSGSIGGSGSAEFMAVTKYGEDVLLYCPSCGYGGNQEKATAYIPKYPEIPFEDLKRIDTPNIKSVLELEKFMGMNASQMVKTIVLVADGNPVIVSMRGDLEISLVKLANLLNADTVEMASADVVEAVTGAPVGFAGPIDLFDTTKVPYFFDTSVSGMRNFLCGGNAADVHYIGVNTGRDFPSVEKFHDLAKAVAGQFCSSCETAILEEKKGIELGHIFQLQQVYSEPMNATFVNENGEQVPFWMGCYGIGVSRIVQTLVEQHHDSRGIIWPIAVTPFQAVIIPTQFSGEYETIALGLYERLKSEGVSVLLDDRNLRIGEKLTDAELQGWPFQIIVGRSWTSEQKLEIHCRDERNYDSSVFVKQNASLPVTFMGIEECVNFLKSNL